MSPLHPPKEPSRLGCVGFKLSDLYSVQQAPKGSHGFGDVLIRPASVRSHAVIMSRERSLKVDWARWGGSPALRCVVLATDGGLRSRSTPRLRNRVLTSGVYTCGQLGGECRHKPLIEMRSERTL
jgi:hypothetical protein